MNPEDKDMIRRTLELTEENHKILRGILSRNRWSNFFRILYWVLIVCVAIGAYIKVQPFIGVIFNAYTSITSDIEAVKNLSNKVNIFK